MNASIFKLACFKAKQKLCFALIFVLGSLGFSQDELYAPLPPPNSAFVRLVQADQAAAKFEFSIDGLNYGELSFSESSPYRVIAEGQSQLHSKNNSYPLEIEAGKFYTAVLNADGIHLLNDDINSNRAKALLSLYNLSSAPSIELKTADGQTDVLSDVAPNSLKSIEVNGITVDLAVFSDGTELELLKELKLERGAAYSVIVLDAAVVWVQSVTLND